MFRSSAPRAATATTPAVTPPDLQLGSIFKPNIIDFITNPGKRIFHLKEGVEFKGVHFVEMDHIVLISKTKVLERKVESVKEKINKNHGAMNIYTTDVATCIAICIRAKDKNGLPLLGMCHWSGIDKPKAILSYMQNTLITKFEAEKDSIQFSFYGSKPEALEEQKKLLALNNVFKIVPGSLNTTPNVSEEDEQKGLMSYTNVLMTTSMIEIGIVIPEPDEQLVESPRAGM